MKRLPALLLASTMIVSLLSGCAGAPAAPAAAEPAAAVQEAAEEVKEEAAEAVEEAAEVVEEAAEEVAEEAAEAVEEVAEEAAAAVEDIDFASAVLPRNETFYLAGYVFQKPNAFSPLSPNPACSFVQNADSATNLMYESLYTFNWVTGVLEPQLAIGDPEWDDEAKTYTVKINPDAHWSDGTDVTAEDFAYTYATHVKYGTGDGNNYPQYIESVEAADDDTLVVTCKLNDEGLPVNKLLVLGMFPRMLVMQKAYLQTVEERNGEDPEKVKNDVCEDYVTTAAYKLAFYNDQKLILVRDDNYWGQAESFMGKLPTPKYIVNIVMGDNDAKAVALRAGEIDECELYYANVETLWEDEGLPISCYSFDEPYAGPCVRMPTLWFNLDNEYLAVKEVRQAIAYAIDYDKIAANAMTNQGVKFADAPRAVVSSTPAERAYYDAEELADYSYPGNEIERANKVLDDAGIVDTDGDGIREIDGTNLSFKAECPNGWSDWQAAIEIVADAGKNIGIDIQTYYPERAVQVTDYSTRNFDMVMQYVAGASVANPWLRCNNLMYSGYADLETNTLGNFGGYRNERVDEILALIPNEEDEEQLKAYYTELSKIYLTDVPSLTLMYRPTMWYIISEAAWTGMPHMDDEVQICPDVANGMKQFFNLEYIGE